MTSPRTDFPPVRACIFDMDGLLINSEDVITQSINECLALNRGRPPPISRDVRVKMMGVPDSSNGDVFHHWAQLPAPNPAAGAGAGSGGGAGAVSDTGDHDDVSVGGGGDEARAEWRRQCGARMRENFAGCVPLPGAETLLGNLSSTATTTTGDRTIHHPGRGAGEGEAEGKGTTGKKNKNRKKVELALASSTKTSTFGVKTTRPETRRLLDHIEPRRRVLGDDPRVREGRGKPAGDIYLVALGVINEDYGGMEDREEGKEVVGRPGPVPPVRPEECLVFEDSVAGVEAGRRAGMRVVWVPHPDVAAEYDDEARRKVLAGRSGMFRITPPPAGAGGGDPAATKDGDGAGAGAGENENENWQLGQIDDGWAECIDSLEEFDYGKYGIQI